MLGSQGNSRSNLVLEKRQKFLFPTGFLESSILILRLITTVALWHLGMMAGAQGRPQKACF